MIGNNGEMLISLKGIELKNRVISEQFKVSKAPEAKKKELEKLAQVVSNNEDILMIVK
jgi:ribosomal protein S8